MQCTACGGETPDGSLFCENCGQPLREPAIFQAVLSDESLVPDDVGESPVPDVAAEADSAAAWAYPGGTYADYVRPVFYETQDAPLVDLPTPPPELRLSNRYVAVIATIATLFSAAVILLAFALIIRFWGL